MNDHRSYFGIMLPLKVDSNAIRYNLILVKIIAIEFIIRFLISHIFKHIWCAVLLLFARSIVDFITPARFVTNQVARQG